MLGKIFGTRNSGKKTESSGADTLSAHDRSSQVEKPEDSWRILESRFFFSLVGGL